MLAWTLARCERGLSESWVPGTCASGDVEFGVARGWCTRPPEIASLGRPVQPHLSNASLETNAKELLMLWLEKRLRC